MKERADKEEAKRKKEEDKRKREEVALRKKSTPGKDFFRVLEPGDFTVFDDDGVPTHKKGKKTKEKDGSVSYGPDVEIQEKERQKLRVKMEKQEKTYQAWLEDSK